MDIKRTGIILYTANFPECVKFYREIMGLHILFENDELTCFDFGGSYLMVEGGGAARPFGKSAAENPMCLRFNVTDLKKCTQQLRDKGVEIEYAEHAWGATATFFDPDGNICALREEPAFAAQITKPVKKT